MTASLLLRPPSWASDAKKHKRTSWAHAPPSPHYTNNSYKCHYYCELLLGICVLSPGSCSLFLQVEEVSINLCDSKLPHSALGWWNFPPGYGPLNGFSAWIRTQVFPLISEEFYLFFKCHISRFSFQMLPEPFLLILRVSLWHPLVRAFYHAGWHWVFWISDSTHLTT